MMAEHESRGARGDAVAKRLAVGVGRHAVALFERAREVKLTREAEFFGYVGETEVGPIS